MKAYKVALTRTYIVTIEAENEEKAKLYSEYYLGNYPDLSTDKDRIKRSFKIKHLEMVCNEAYEIIRD
ncbi:MAG: hypothetical protein H8D45_14400 [Bacteroidetes bacterium]|nr:hypothetical protein [Bacteroidota bacterium]MBL7105257.1 hypothetical protein [Bacteroidales bacterium]